MFSPYHYPVTNKDADGEIFDTILDVAFIAADVIDIGVSIAQGKGVSTEQIVSLTANVVCAAVPGMTGGGAIAKAVMKVDKAADVIKTGIKAEKALVNTGKTVKAVDKVSYVSKTVKTTEKVTKTEQTSRAARREVMREQKIPTSQQPKSQSKNASGREYTYEVKTDGGKTVKKSVQQQTKDATHKDRPHWEAGNVRKGKDGKVKVNSYGRVRLDSQKSKVNYKEN